MWISSIFVKLKFQMGYQPKFIFFSHKVIFIAFLFLYPGRLGVIIEPHNYVQ